MEDSKLRNIKLTLEYDGSRYQGWARLGKDESSNTISNKVVEVIKKMTDKEEVEMFCGCRTEVGVHAYEQVVNFKTETNMTLIEMKRYLNRYLPMDIAVTDIEEMQERFHAQLNARSKVYMYRVAISEVPSVFERKYTYHSFKTPNVKVMREAAKALVGKYNFKNFSTAKKSKSTIREIYAIDIYDDGEEIQITIHADDFLHNMARLIIGTVLDIGLGERQVSDIDAIFGGTKPVSAPCDPKGLYLQEIKYE